jgi:hypothetical protein
MNSIEVFKNALATHIMDSDPVLVAPSHASVFNDSPKVGVVELFRGLRQ